jgi:metal-sulfur cluster biosynthetic enzyme
MLTEDDILDALRACFDTQNPYQKAVNIVDLGLVESISLTLDPEAPGAGVPGVPPRQSLTLAIIPSSSDEDASAILLAQIQNRLAGIPNLSRTTIQLRDQPIWTPARVTPQGRRLLQLDAPSFPILNNRV